MRLQAISFLPARRFQQVAGGLLSIAVTLSASIAVSQDNSGYYTDPATGVVYRQVQRTIERPVVETQMRTQESTIYRPETVVSTRPETRTVYTPVVSYNWEPRLQNRWNPFVQPTVVYQHTPRTHWETRNETIDRQEARTNWVAETRKVDVPQQIVRIQREVKTELEPVGKVTTPQQAVPPNSTQAAQAAIAARLRPMDANTRYEPLYGYSRPMGNVAGMANDPYRRNEFQGGMRANELYPTPAPGYGTPLPPASNGLGVAGLPLPSVWR
jgi:hypothetical protein